MKKMTTETPTQNYSTMPTRFVQRVKVCPTCKTDDFTSTKFHDPDKYIKSNFQLHYCHRCEALVEPVWLCAETHTRSTSEHPLHMVERLQEEVARLTKRLKRYEAVQAARDAALAATLTDAVEQAEQAESDTAAADFYGSFGRDEWPTR